MMPEAEAKKLWCPLRAKPGSPATYRGDMWDSIFRRLLPRMHWFYRMRHTRCRGGGCMMWRWTDAHRSTGYCGIAGNPVLFRREV